jgi:Lanthionine synthetase C-like protein
MATLLRLQLESGNFPSSEGSLRDVLVQFCHGASGFLISFHSVKNAFPDLEAEIAVATERAEECVLTRRVLRKIPCFCHGLYGNALAVKGENMMKMLKIVYERDIRWDESTESEDIKYGLFTGLAGRAWAMAMAATGKQGIVLGYNDI